jgi:hypothetical protein
VFFVGKKNYLSRTALQFFSAVADGKTKHYRLQHLKFRRRRQQRLIIAREYNLFYEYLSAVASAVNNEELSPIALYF